MFLIDFVEPRNSWESVEKGLDEILLEEETEEEEEEKLNYENFDDLKHECDEISEEFEEDEEIANSSSTEDLSYEKIIEAVHNNDVEFFQKFDRSSTDIKLPLSSSTSSSSIESSECNRALYEPQKLINVISFKLFNLRIFKKMYYIHLKY